jgi:hypothetical protein
MAKSTHDYGSASHWDQVLMAEFEKESDRAAVILVASLFENALGMLLRHFLVAATTADDELLDGANAPLSTFSARTSLSRRLGLISSKFARDLHLIRKIRNEFAHNVHGCNFESGGVRARVLELAKSSQLLERNVKLRGQFPAGPRSDFLLIASWMLYALNDRIERSVALKEAPEEWGYSLGAAEWNWERSPERESGTATRDTVPKKSPAKDA